MGKGEGGKFLTKSFSPPRLYCLRDILKGDDTATTASILLSTSDLLVMMCCVHCEHGNIGGMLSMPVNDNTSLVECLLNCDSETVCEENARTDPAGFCHVGRQTLSFHPRTTPQSLDVAKQIQH